MKVLITAATNHELEQIEKRELKNSMLDIHLAVTGVGMIATTYHLMQQLQEAHFDLMVQIGIAGSFDHQISLGHAISVASESVPEMGVIEHNEYKDIFSLQLADPNQFPFQDGALINTHKDLLSKTTLPQLSAVTVNQISTKKRAIDRYKNNYHASIESMEGAAFHYVGLMQHIPFLQVRGISNYVGERDKKNWKIKEAIASSTLACWNLLQQLSVK